MEEISGSIPLVGIALSLFVIMVLVSNKIFNKDLEVLSTETAVTINFHSQMQWILTDAVYQLILSMRDKHTVVQIQYIGISVLTHWGPTDATMNLIRCLEYENACTYIRIPQKYSSQGTNW